MAELQKRDSFVEDEVAIASLEASAVLELELDGLLDWCEEFEIDSSDFVADSEFQSALLEAIKQRGQCQLSAPPLTAFASSFARDFRLKRERLFQLVDVAQKFVESETVRPWLKKLRLPQMPAWMTAQDFKRAKEVANKVKPLLLFAGSTSCGKSTLLNALLGTPLLPTSHNAATSTLCEIKFSSSGKKFAILHTREGQTRKQQEIDLSNQEGVKLFSQFTCNGLTQRRSSTGISRSLSGGLLKLPSVGAVPQGDEQPVPEKVCVKAEIYWPLEFLKDFSLVDSPGVTEEEGSSSARQITEQFQKEHACGYVYVLDGTRAAEEAAQVGGLLKAVVKATKSPPPAGCAIFVVNKWDLVVQQQSDSEQTDFLRRVAQCLEQRWPGFDAGQQLVTMNAKIAAQAQELGHITPDIEKLCDKIRQTLPAAVEHLLLKPLSCVNELLGQVEQSIDGTVRYLHLPVEEQIQKHKRDCKQLYSLKESQETGSLATTMLEVNQKIDELVLELAHYLKSGEGFKVVGQHGKKSTQEEMATSIEAENVQYIVEEGFTEAICQFPKVDVFRNWAISAVTPVAQRIIGELARVRGFSAQLKPTSLEEMISGQIDSSRVERVQYIVGAAALALPINWPGILLGGVAYALGGERVGNMVMKLLCPGAWVFAGLNKKLFWDTTEKVYNDLVQKFCDNNCKKLRQYVKSLLENTVEPVGLICREIPKCIHIMEDELKTRVEQELGCSPTFSEILQVCREVKGELSAYMVAQKIHRVDISQLDFGAFAGSELVSKVILMKKGEAMLKRLPDPISERNADELLKRMTVSRNAVSDNVVSFYGSVVLCAEPLRIGLLFEWCSNGSLADIIYSEANTPPGHRRGFQKYKNILLQIAGGLKYLHGVGIVHAGLTPKTILFTKNNKVKLCEVKSPNRLYTSSSNRISCNRDDFVYIAPEILNWQPCSVSCDIYSLGIVLWEMWNGRLAYEDFDFFPDFVNEVSQGTRPEGFKRLPVESPDGTSSLDRPCPDESLARDWEELTKCCWIEAPSERPTANELYDMVLKMGSMQDCKQ